MKLSRRNAVIGFLFVACPWLALMLTLILYEGIGHSVLRFLSFVAIGTPIFISYPFTCNGALFVVLYHVPILAYLAWLIYKPSKLKFRIFAIWWVLHWLIYFALMAYFGAGACYV